MGSCPIGALQNELSSYRFRFPYYVVGLLLFFGALLGRAICGFLCPFGFLQDLLHRIPLLKGLQKCRVKKTFPGDMLLRKLKYVVLVFLVIILPMSVKLTPFFCKYLCPSGTLAGILLALGDHQLFAIFGKLFTWKACILAGCILLSLIIYRPFCKYLCPLGAIYGPCNKISVLKILLDSDACLHCGRCMTVCQMCVDSSVDPNHSECIRCGACIQECPVKALKYGR